jgi:hypothetical protein
MKLISKIRAMIVFFMVALVLSGLTAFPVETELRWLLSHPSLVPAFAELWLTDVYRALADTNKLYPMIAYGFDWLAFAHLIIAMLFIGPLKDPVKNSWVIEWAMLACVAIFPLAFICGPIRQIPLFHILIDCSFGVIGLIPLWICRRWIRKLAAANNPLQYSQFNAPL